MDEIQQLLKEVQQLIDNKEYEAADKKLPDAILEKYNNADLYAQKARACDFLEQGEKAKNYAEVAIQLDKNCTAAYNTLGGLYSDKKDYKKAEEYYKKAIEIEPKFVHAYYNLGNLYHDKKDYNNAEQNYKIALELDQNYVYAYYNLGNLYSNKRDYNNAEQHYKKALELDPNDVIAYNNLGNLYNYKKDYNKAVENYKKALAIDSNYSYAHYNLGLTYEEIGELENAIKSFQKWLEIVKDTDDSDIKYIQDKIEELQKQLNDKEYNEVSKLVDEIKSLLKYNGNSITHYTSLSIARLLILEESPIRISEAAFLNDTSEGTALFDFLQIDTEHGTHNKNAQPHIPFVKKPFIGSFVADNKCNDLTLWRMYGKENNEEAKGCAITVDAITFLESVKQELLQPTVSETQSVEDDFQLYNVGYITNDDKFIVPANPKISNKINSKIAEIKKSLKAFIDKNPSPERQDDMRELLNRIAYLFKNAEYQYEHEVRLIVRDVRLKREIETKDEKKEPLKLPRVFINLININPYINKITIGPKVANKEEWASIFYYHLQEKQTNKNLEIQVSCLPFK